MLTCRIDKLQQLMLEEKYMRSIYSLLSGILCVSSNQLFIHASNRKIKIEVFTTIFYWNDTSVHFQDLFYNDAIKNIVGTNKAIFYTLNWAQSDCYLSPSWFFRLEMVRITEVFLNNPTLYRTCTIHCGELQWTLRHNTHREL